MACDVRFLEGWGENKNKNEMSGIIVFMNSVDYVVIGGAVDCRRVFAHCALRQNTGTISSAQVEWRVILGARNCLSNKLNRKC